MDINKLIDRIAFLKKEIEKTEFKKSTPIWEWEKMCLELERLSIKMKEVLA